MDPSQPATGGSTGIRQPPGLASRVCQQCGCHPHANRPGTLITSAAGLSAHQSIDLAVFGKPAELFLGEDEPAVDGDLEYAGNPFDELDLLCAAFHEPGLRTEGPRFIVSGHAVFDPDLHCCHPFNGERRQLSIAARSRPPSICAIPWALPIARFPSRVETWSSAQTRLVRCG